MKKHLSVLLAIIFVSIGKLYSQEDEITRSNFYLKQKGEVILSIPIIKLSSIYEWSKLLAIVNYDPKTKLVKAMANQKQFRTFLAQKIPFQVLQSDNEIGEREMTNGLQSKNTTFPLSAYPTYADYTAMMQRFATQNPDLCKLISIGKTTEGDKDIWFAKLSDKVSQNEQEPRVMLTSSMHGDEIAGYPMMLNLIDFLIQTYKNTTHPRHNEIKKLLNESEVWINPLANPDGTFRNSNTNTSVAFATRGNANNIDLNRNYPDPDDGTNPDGNTHQTETLAFMDFANSQHIVLSANFHGGIELANYPWDTYAGAHPDKDYFVYLCGNYRDHCQADGPNNYFDALNNGITNGYAWYEVQGGRQDYQIYFHKGREITIELSNAKTPAANQLVGYWKSNQNALIDFLKQVQYGIRGTVVDATSKQPLAAQILVKGKESYASWVPTELPEGDYYRPIHSGTYDLWVTAPCYESKLVSGVVVSNGQAVVQNIELQANTLTAPTDLIVSEIQTNSVTLNWLSDQTNFELRYRETNSQNWIYQNISESPYTIMNLNPETAYQAELRSLCTNQLGSPFSETITFATLPAEICDAIADFPYFESFEMGFGQWKNDPTAAIDWNLQSGSTPSNGTGPNAASQGNFYTYIEASSNANGNPNKTAILQSPCIDLSHINAARLSFDYHMLGQNIGELEVQVQESDNNSWQRLWVKTGNQGNSWYKANIPLSEYIGKEIQLQIKGVTGNGWRSDIAIDAIQIRTEIGSDEPAAPSNLTASSISSNTLVLRWNTNQTTNNISEYLVYQDGDLVQTTTETSVLIKDLSAATTYAFYILAKNMTGSLSNPSNEVTVTTLDETEISYCNAQGNSVAFEYIDFVEVGGLTNPSTAQSGYSDYTSLQSNLAAGMQTIKIGVHFVNTTYRDHLGAWIDYNRNGVFEPAEQILKSQTDQSGVQEYTFEVPPIPDTIYTRLRIALKYNFAPSPCEYFGYGEVEDYRLQLHPNPITITKEPESSLQNIEIHPNPVWKGKLIVAGLHSQQYYYVITNVLGQKTPRQKISSDVIDVSTLQNGLYFIVLESKEKRISRSFLIKK